MKTNIIKLAIFGAGTCLIGLLTWKTTVKAVEFPIQTLGNCRDNRECHLYCEIPTNHAACWSYSVYGVKNDVLGDESPEEKIKPLGITFPIPELGSCGNVASCKDYCNDPTHQDACYAFAQSHGLNQKERIVEKARSDLGCTTLESCKTFCNQEVNHDACSEFAKRYHLSTIIHDSLIDQAKTELGCASRAECRRLCALPENQAKCQNFVSRFDPRTARREELIQKAAAELGCTSFASCKAFCQNEANRDKCRNFGLSLREHITNEVKERGDCATVEECRKACQQNPDGCPQFPKRQGRVHTSGFSPLPLKLNRGPGSLNQGPGSVNSRLNFLRLSTPEAEASPNDSDSGSQ